MKTFKVNGISVNDHEGGGNPLIFIHAFPLCSRMWDDQVNFFRDKYRVITYDIRGLGYSNELDSWQFTMEELVNDFFNVIDHLKLDKVNACGLSMGGYILLRAVLSDESRFSSVTFADTRATAEDSDSLLIRSSQIIKIKAGGREEFLDDFLKKLLSEEGYNDVSKKDFVRMMMGWMSNQGLIANLLAIATRTNSFYHLKNINVPALVIAGRKDTVTPVVNSFYIKEGIKNSFFKVIDNAGHLSNIESPDEFNDSLNNFLKNLK